MVRVQHVLVRQLVAWRRLLVWQILALFGASVLQPAASVNVLVLGGTGFRGHPTTEHLARLGYNVTVLSRGLEHWGTVEMLKKLGVTHWACNRTIDRGSDYQLRIKDTGLAMCGPLVNSSTVFNVVVDFSSRTVDQFRQVHSFLKGRIEFYIFLSTHAVYTVSKNSTHGESYLLEADAVRPGRDVSPLERYQLKAKSTVGDAELEIEEELLKQYDSGGFPFTNLRLTNVVGPKENTIRYWLLHLWIRAHLALTMPMQLDETLLETPISLTYTLDIARAVARVISKARKVECCPEQVEGEAFNLACEQAPTQRELYNLVAEPMGLPYVETQEKSRNKSVVLYPEIVRGPVRITKALEVLRWTPTDLAKALRSVARFYDRVMIDEKKYKRERDLMYTKCKKMLGEDGPRFMSWIRAYYDERRKTELYDELDDEDEEEIVTVRSESKRSRRKRQKRTRADGNVDL